MNMFGGIRVLASQALPKVSVVPVRAHKLNPRKVAYHTRIQKKWNKRFGTREDLYFVMAQGVIFAHPDNIELLKSQIGT